jgi:hypothetical protein
MIESIFGSAVMGIGLVAAAAFAPFSGMSDAINSRLHEMSDRGALHKTASSTISAVDIACISAAVDAREKALVAGEGSFTKAVDAAYSARATALHSAYTQSGNDAIRKAVDAAWKSFTEATRSAQKTWRSAQGDAWKSFNTAARACKAPSSVNDTKKSKSEISGE